MKDPKSVMIRNIIILILIVLVLVLGTLYQNYKNPNPTGKVVKASEAEKAAAIIQHIKKFPEIQKFSFNDYDVYWLSEEEVNELSAKEPLIYGNLPGEVYKIELKGYDSNLLVFYHLESDRIVEKFSVLSSKFA